MFHPDIGKLQKIIPFHHVFLLFLHLTFFHFKNFLYDFLCYNYHEVVMNVKAQKMPLMNLLILQQITLKRLLILCQCSEVQ